MTAAGGACRKTLGSQPAHASDKATMPVYSPYRQCK